MNNDTARSLLRLADMDINAARILGGSGEGDAEIIGFHLQQAVEKLLKAWLVLLDEHPGRTHDLSYLLEKLSARGEPVQAFQDLMELNPFAVQFRYDVLDAEPFDWRPYLERTIRLRDIVQKRLQGDRK